MNEEPSYDDFVRQQEEIEQFQKQAPVVSSLFPISIIKQELYTSVQDEKMKQLADANYILMRQVRGDGNCFYRSVLFSLFEGCIVEKDVNKLKQCTQLVGESLNKIVTDLNYPEYTLEDFHQSMLEFCEWLLDEMQKVGDNEESLLLQEFTAKFSNDDISSALICYSRFMLSHYLQTHRDEFEAFVFATDYTSLDQYCRNEIESMYKDADHLAIVGFTNMWGICLQIEYIDVSQHQHSIKIPDDPLLPPTIFLLFRPGHYDILYREN